MPRYSTRNSSNNRRNARVPPAHPPDNYFDAEGYVNGFYATHGIRMIQCAIIFVP